MENIAKGKVNLGIMETSGWPNLVGNSRRLELGLWATVLAMVNLPLLQGGVAEYLIFFPSEVAIGQWWRVVTFPFVHVSWYHLLLDGSAFLLLYAGLEEEGVFKRILYVVLCGASSLLFTLWFSPIIKAQGLCGLSGIAHGLMAVTALELIKRHPRGSALFRTGVALLVTVTAKSLIEALMGQVLFADLHFGAVGLPLAESHAGGLIGGIIAFVLLRDGSEKEFSSLIGKDFFRI